MSTAKLSETQLVVLTAAGGRDDGAVLPLPPSLNLRGGAADKVLTSLLKRGLVEERPAALADTAWREAEDGGRYLLRISAAGLEAIGAGLEGTDQPAKKPTTREPKRARKAGPGGKAAAPKIRSGTKQSLLINLLRRDAGATLPELTVATGWQAHSVRGVISGALKTKLGLVVTSEVEEGRGRIYRIVGGEGQ
jgi:hypothetical protein